MAFYSFSLCPGHSAGHFRPTNLFTPHINSARIIVIMVVVTCTLQENYYFCVIIFLKLQVRKQAQEGKLSCPCSLLGRELG